MVISPARIGARPNLRRRIFRTTLLGSAVRGGVGGAVVIGMASALFFVFVDGLGCGGDFFRRGVLVEDLALLAAGGFVGSAGLGFGDGFFGFFCGLAAGGGFVPVAGDFLDVTSVDDELRAVAGVVVDFRVDQRQRDFGHARRLALAGAGEDDVFHLDAAQSLSGLLAQHPRDGVGDVGLAAAVGADDDGDALAGELHFGAIAERFEAENLDFAKLEQRDTPTVSSTANMGLRERDGLLES